METQQIDSTVEDNKVIATYMGRPFDHSICDYCSSINPETFPKSRLTVCCSTYDRDDRTKAFYNTVDKDGREVWSIGKKTKWGVDKAENLTYHLSWDQLMEVLKKISKRREVSEFSIGLHEVRVFAWTEETVFKKKILTNKIREAVHKTIAQLIGWLNEIDTKAHGQS